MPERLKHHQNNTPVYWQYCKWKNPSRCPELLYWNIFSENHGSTNRRTFLEWVDVITRFSVADSIQKYSTVHTWVRGTHCRTVKKKYFSRITKRNCRYAASLWGRVERTGSKFLKNWRQRSKQDISPWEAWRTAAEQSARQQNSSTASRKETIPHSKNVNSTSEGNQCSFMSQAVLSALATHRTQSACTKLHSISKSVRQGLVPRSYYY